MLAKLDIDKTDEQIHQMAMEEWLSVLVRLWEAVGKTVDVDRLEIYRRELVDIPLGVLENAVSRVIREHTYANVPTVGEIWRSVRTELGNPTDVLQAIENWSERSWERCFYRFENVAVETEA